MKARHIAFPYLPPGKTIYYVPKNNAYMGAARDYALAHSLDRAQPTGSAVVAGGTIIGLGANGSTFHNTQPCQRVVLGIPTGQGYDLCEGCHPKNHSEPRAIAAAHAAGFATKGAALYLWGHWWCCQPCWQAILGGGIARVYAQQRSEIDFNRTHPNNILPLSDAAK